MPTSEPVNRLRKAFRASFEIDLPQEFVCEGLQEAMDGNLLSTQPAGILRLLVRSAASVVNEFPVSPGHHTVGFWGHGVNSHAFYAIFRNANESVYLRLHRGGAYTDPVKMAADITNYVLAFTQMLRATRTANGQLFAMESMGRGFYRYAIDGTHAELTESLFGRPDMGDELLALTDPDLRAQRHARKRENTVTRDEAFNIASDIYHVEMRRAGNERVGMRAMGAAKDWIMGVALTLPPREYQQTLLMTLAELRERYRDSDGEHAHAHACVDQLIEQWKALCAGRSTC